MTRRIGLAALFAVGILAAAPGRAQTGMYGTGQFGVEQILPSETILLVTVPNMRSGMEAFRRSPAHDILAHRDVARIWHNYRVAATRQRHNNDIRPTLLDLMVDIDMSPSQLVHLFPEDLSLAFFTHNDTLRWALVGRASDPVLVDEIRKTASDFFSAMARAGYVVEPGWPTYRDVTIEAWQTEHSAYAMAVVRDMFVFVEGRDAMESFIDRAQGSGGAMLSANDGYRQLRGEFKEQNLIVYADLKRLRDTWLGEKLNWALTLDVPPQWNVSPTIPMPSLLKFDARMMVGWLFGSPVVRENWAMSFDPGTMPQAKVKGLVEAGQDHSTLRTIRYLPVDSRAVAFSNLQSKLAQDMAVQGEAAFARMPSGRSIALVSIMEAGEDQAELVRAQVQTLVQKLESAGVRPDTKRVRNFTVVSISKKELQNVPYTTVAVDAQHRTILIGSSLTATEKVIRQSRHPDSSLQRHEDYREALKRLNPTQPPNLQYFADARRLLEEKYVNVVSHFQSQAATLGFRWGLDFDEILDRYVSGVLVEMRVGDNMIRAEGVGPLGVWPMQMGLRYLNQMLAPEEVVEAESTAESDLQRIAAGIHLYAADYDRFPNQLSQLYRAIYVPDLTAFVAEPGAEVDEAIIDTASSYVYIPGRSLSDVADAIIAFEREADERNERWTLPVFGPPRKMHTKALRKRLEADDVEVRIPVRAKTKEEESFLAIP